MKHIFLFGYAVLLINFFALSQNWQRIGTYGFNQVVKHLYPDPVSGNLYIAGNFSYADSIPVNYIARWNGTNLDSVPKTWNKFIKCFIRYNNDLYAAENYIFKWNGVDWDTVGKVNDFSIVYHMAIYNNELIIMGGFDSINNIPASKIARWNGTTWSALDTTKWFTFITCSAVLNGELFVGGNMVNSTGSIKYLARWNGQNWSPVGNNAIYYGGGSVVDLEAYKGELYITGAFRTSFGNPGNGIVKWTGTQWNDLGGGFTGFNNSGREMTVFNNELYVVGAFAEVAYKPASLIAKWDSVKWCTLGPNNTTGLGITTCVFNNQLYIGGGIPTIDGDTIKNMAKWIGGSYTDSCVVINSVQEPIPQFSVSIFPNPVIDLVQIEVEGGTYKKTTITDLLSRVILVSRENTLHLSSLNSGVYLFSIETDKGTFLRKIVKN
jgi:trimeric autotransporter adhesin